MLKSFSALRGHVLRAVQVIRADEYPYDRIIFDLNSGERYMLYHDQNCCEDVHIDDICGDLLDLIGSEIMVAEEATNKDETPGGIERPAETGDSYTWTFYTLRTMRDTVTIRWYGSSNGYYSEGVDWVQVVSEDMLANLAAGVGRGT